MVTGEPTPVEKSPGDRLIGATINGTGSVMMRAERVGADTLLAQIVRMVGEAQRSRAPIQGLADRVAAWFVPAVVLVALAAFAAWGLWGPEPRLAHAVPRPGVSALRRSRRSRPSPARVSPVPSKDTIRHSEPVHI